MLKIFAVGLGGFIGAISRYLAGNLFLKYIPSAFPIGTLTINFIGAFLIGLISEYSLRISTLNPILIAFINIGILGGFTTFSTFSLETVNLFENGKFISAFIYVLSSVILCLAGVFAGKYIIRLI